MNPDRMWSWQGEDFCLQVLEHQVDDNLAAWSDSGRLLAPLPGRTGTCCCHARQPEGVPCSPAVGVGSIAGTSRRSGHCLGLWKLKTYICGLVTDKVISVKEVSEKVVTDKVVSVKVVSDKVVSEKVVSDAKHLHAGLTHSLPSLRFRSSA